MMVSQNSTPGSADFQALYMILSQIFEASTSLVKVGFLLSTGYCCTYFFPEITARINLSSILTDTLAPVTFPCSSLASIKSSASGCLLETDNIKAPRRPSCATSRVELEYLSIKGTMPVEVKAEFITGLPFGRICDKSCPTPPLLFIN